ncbi:MAG: single-stranded-DNA-specific exonuclease RecJ [Cytophagaceae bacterium]|jgi:single-stranded-DNA-specific exonuclease|nr:single-stranded-DNA-specific exonuclease RecJ [Cytophagaceae bacterium]
MNKKWIIQPVPPKESVEKLSNEINVNPQLASLLIQRGVKTFDEAKRFFRPSLADLHDPFLMKDMDKAVNRLKEALDLKEKIMVYGDYDVDGTTSVSLVYGYLKNKCPHLIYYIPDRYLEGYGISTKGIDTAKEAGVQLIIALDCGIKSPDKIDYARSLGIDFIICDHHLPGDHIPKAAAVLDAKQQDCQYPFKELCGCGVGFKFMQAMSNACGWPESELHAFLDLVAIATCSDIVPMVGENRTLVALGIAEANKGLRPGIKALMEVAGFSKIREVSSIVFALGPRINAAGRIAHAHAAVQLLLSQTEEEAAALAKNLNDHNATRKDYDSSITEEAIQMIEEDTFLRDAWSSVLYKESWHKGVIGIVASRCIEKYYRPTIVLTKSGDYAAGSARSVAGFDVHEAIGACEELLLQYGGHMYAAGLTMKPENIPAFREKFDKVVRDTIEEASRIPNLIIDQEIRLDQVNYRFYNILKQMAPFGPQNMQPVFLCKGVQDSGRSRLLKDLHLKLSIKQGNSAICEAIGFGMPEYFERIKKGDKFNLCFSLEENEFNGERSLQLQIRDIKFEGEE